MARASKGLALIAAGFALGFLLFFVSSLANYGISDCGGCRGEGLPFYWSITASGTGGPVLLLAFALDLGIWVALSMAVVYYSYHVSVSRVRGP